MKSVRQRVKAIASKFAGIVFRSFVETVIPGLMGGVVLIAFWEVAAVAPELAAIVVSASLIALAIYKRPASKFESHYTINGEMPVEHVTANVDVRVLKALVDAARDEGKAA